MNVKSCEYKNLNKACKVVSSSEATGYLHVRLPYEMSGYRMYDFLEVSSCPVKSVSFDRVKFDGYHHWVDVPWSNVNKSAGHHVYKLSFMNTCKRENKYVNVYFNYVFQDDMPEKPYVYINSLKTCCGDSDEKEGKYLSV